MSKKVFNRNELHEITLKILDKYNLDNSTNVTALAEQYSEKYFEVYNYLESKIPSPGVR